MNSFHTYTRIKRIMLFVCVFSFCIPGFGQKDFKTEDYYHCEIFSNTVIVKLKPEYRQFAGNEEMYVDKLKDFFRSIQVISVEKIFKNHTEPNNQNCKDLKRGVDISLIYEIRFEADIPVLSAVRELKRSGVFDYVQPRFVHKILKEPDDPAIPVTQWQHNNINSYAAWDITTGNTDVVIGISDTGTDLFHHDLSGNIYYNVLDPIDGIDNDNDGYVDNYYGWDFGDNDNNPQYGTNSHGVFVSGISSAVGDNATGGAGVAYGCKFLPVKIMDANSKLVKTYESLVYLADHGADVINCSWGGAAYHDQFGQDMVNYCTFNRGVVVVAACGNDNNTVPFYPASYDYVISVASLDIHNVKGTTSSYGDYVDVAAPGQNVYSTSPNNTYGFSSGTSYAAPMVSAAVALLKSYKPELTAIQLIERIKQTTDNIDTVPGNANFINQLGTGKLNLYKMLTDPERPAIVAENTKDTTIAGQVIIYSDYTNYNTIPASDITIRAESSSPYFTFTNTIFSIEHLNFNETVSSIYSPFTGIISENIPENEMIKIKFTITVSDTLTSYCYYSFPANTKNLLIHKNNIITTMTAKSKIGYSDWFYSQGEGFRFNSGTSLLNYGGLLFSKASYHTSDYLLNEENVPQNDFLNVLPPYIAEETDHFLHTKTVYNDNLAGINKLGIEVEESILAWNYENASDFVIYQYILRNKGESPHYNLYAGIYNDWDIKEPFYNTILWDPIYNMSYVTSGLGLQMVGVSYLSNYPTKTYAFDNDGSNYSLNIKNGFTSSQKYTALTTNRLQAGNSATGNDVSLMNSYGPLTIMPHDSVVLAFVIAAGQYLGSLQQSVEAANEYYYYKEDNGSGMYELNKEASLRVYPNPTSGLLSFSTIQNKDIKGQVSIFDISGSEVMSDFINEDCPTLNISRLNPGAYFGKITTGETILTFKILKY